MDEFSISIAHDGELWIATLDAPEDAYSAYGLGDSPDKALGDLRSQMHAVSKEDTEKCSLKLRLEFSKIRKFFEVNK